MSPQAFQQSEVASMPWPERLAGPSCSRMESPIPVRASPAAAARNEPACFAGQQKLPGDVHQLLQAALARGLPAGAAHGGQLAVAPKRNGNVVHLLPPSRSFRLQENGQLPQAQWPPVRRNSGVARNPVPFSVALAELEKLSDQEKGSSTPSTSGGSELLAAAAYPDFQSVSDSASDAGSSTKDPLMEMPVYIRVPRLEVPAPVGCGDLAPHRSLAASLVTAQL